MHNAVAGSFNDHQRKVHFRRNWAKPILGHLYNRLRKNLIYVGLPGYRALDILEWQEFIEKVVAFQAVNFDDRDSIERSEREMQELQNILNELETKRIISTYDLYQGYIEQTVMAEEDESNQMFQLQDYITIYNLDFCNSLQTPYPVILKNLETKKFYKVDVIEKLLTIQNSLYRNGSDASFVMFLTVNANFIERMGEEIRDKSLQKYIAGRLRNLGGEKRLGEF